MITEQHFKDLESAAGTLARDLGDCLAHAIDVRGQALLAVSGGRTPATVFRHLRNSRLDWSRIIITLTDERWVPESDPASNAAMVRRELLIGPASAATFVPLYGGEPSPEAGHAACETRLRDLANRSCPADAAHPPLVFDAAYLGMGEDGHIASLFPGDPSVEATDGLCLPVPAHQDRAARITLTPPTLLSARALYLLYGGPEKHQRYQSAKQPGPAIDVPLRLLFAQPGINLKVLSTP